MVKVWRQVPNPDPRLQLFPGVEERVLGIFHSEHEAEAYLVNRFMLDIDYSWEAEISEYWV